MGHALGALRSEVIQQGATLGRQSCRGFNLKNQHPYPGLAEGSKGLLAQRGQLNEKTIVGKSLSARCGTGPPLSATSEWTSYGVLRVPWRTQPGHKIHLWSAAVGGIQTAHLRNGTCNQCTRSVRRSLVHTKGDPEKERRRDGKG